MMCGNKHGLARVVLQNARIDVFKSNISEHVGARQVMRWLDA
jgi:hypothetical protein